MCVTWVSSTEEMKTVAKRQQNNSGDAVLANPAVPCYFPFKLDEVRKAFRETLAALGHDIPENINLWLHAGEQSHVLPTDAAVSLYYQMYAKHGPNVTFYVSITTTIQWQGAAHK
jgi:hypothetical protein